MTLNEYSEREQRDGRAAYEAFCAAAESWLPFPPDWEGQAELIKCAWCVAAKAARA